MKMEIFEYNIYVKNEVIAGTNDLDLAKKIAFKIAKRQHCDVNIINAFTGEVHQSLVSILHVTYNANMEENEKYYEVIELAW